MELKHIPLTEPLKLVIFSDASLGDLKDNAGKDIRGVSAWLVEARPIWQGADDMARKANPVCHKSAVMVGPSKGSSISAEVNAVFEMGCQLVESFSETRSTLPGHPLPIEVHTDSEAGLRCVARVTSRVNKWAVGACVLKNSKRVAKM